MGIKEKEKKIDIPQQEKIGKWPKNTQDIRKEKQVGSTKEFIIFAQKVDADLVFINPYDECFGKEKKIRSIKVTAIGKKGEIIVFHDHKKVVDATSEKNTINQTRERKNMTKSTYAKMEKKLPGRKIRAPGIFL